MNDGAARTTSRRHEPHYAHQGKKYNKIVTAVDRTHTLGRRARASDTRAVTVTLWKSFEIYTGIFMILYCNILYRGQPYKTYAKRRFIMMKVY